MLKRIIKIILQIILIFSIFVIQKGFFNGLFAYVANINIVFVYLVFILVFLGFRSAIMQAIIFSLLFEIFSFYPPGFYLIAILISTLVLGFLLKNFFTNHSLYTIIAMNIIMTVIFSLLFYFELFVYYKVSFQDNFVSHFGKSFEIEFIGLLLNVFSAFILFYVINSISKRIQPAFLLRGR